ncbi:hypothetical protein ACFQUU_00660 [Herbaspirillum sp. GCM10030257]|uniref:hypothetical protein n=1 Tax=Herbaspirillum sp. GCM10030257 TaxID=3273393 RepID=UPI00361A1484
MKSWRQAMRDGLISGSIASVLSTIVLSARGEQEEGTPYAPTNAISHWFFGDHAFYRNGRTLRYTGTGYAIHHASSTLWAVVYERWFGERADRRDLPTALTGGAAVAAMACFTDYHLTPRRLHPGYEKRLSSASLFLVYAAFGAGLVVRGLTTSPARTYR